MRTVSLTRKDRFFIEPTPPFHFDGTFHKPSHFPAPLDAWEPGRFWQAMRLGRRVVGLRIEDYGSRARPRLAVTVFARGGIAAAQRDALRRELVWRFDLAADLREFNRIARDDRRFGRVLRRWRGTRDSWPHSLYDLLVISILLQNATVRRTVQMMNALLARFGRRLRFDSRELFVLWPPDALRAVSEEDLRALKIGYRARFLTRLSQDVAARRIDELALRSLDEDAARRELMKLYGVGPESAQILLYPACHRSSALRHIAPWQQKIYSRLFYDRPLVPARRILRDFNLRYGKYASLAVGYLWEDLFWRRTRESIPWLEREIRL
jgi:DNA-3-methyladenine glycosylase II